MHYRRVRVRQEHADQRGLAQVTRPSLLSGQGPTGRVRRHRRHRQHRQGRQHRPVAHWPHTPKQSGDVHRYVHAHPRAVRHHARGSCARLQAGPILLQRQGRSLRGVQRRRLHQHRNAVLARCHRAVRDMRRQAIQPRSAGDRVQGQKHRRRSEHDRVRGRGVFREHSANS